MADTYLDDLKTVGFKHFNPMWSFPGTSVNQNWDPITFGMPPYHLKEDSDHDKDALVSQSPIVVFKAATVLQSLGIIASRVLPSSDVKGEKKNKTYCPSTWNFAYQYHSPAEYSDSLRSEGANSLLRREGVLSVIVQLSSKSVNHPHSPFADSASSVLSGMMISLTPVSLPKIPRPIQLSASSRIREHHPNVRCSQWHSLQGRRLCCCTDSKARVQGCYLSMESAKQAVCLVSRARLREPRLPL